ncbi:hypothetical protein Taro_018504 [Colocasia esculenta]|uniref:Uncharacterized protein n=1 Tax=Colocasia esculenta TaxID=4460 RepID=A0A843V2M7_COLES|nr:hypothetical protein [Colocasia esculenta]
MALLRLLRVGPVAVAILGAFRADERGADGGSGTHGTGAGEHCRERGAGDAGAPNAARSTVPGGPSVACSTAKAVEWDAAWSKNLDPSGRAALGVHTAAYGEPVDLISPSDKSTPVNGFFSKLGEDISEATVT